MAGVWPGRLRLQSHGHDLSAFAASHSFYNSGVRRSNHRERLSVAPSEIFKAGLTLWRKTSQIFGPLLAAGVLLGLGLTSLLHISLTAPWLTITYALIVVVIVFQVAIMVPWQIRSNRMLATGIMLPSAPVATVLLLLCAGYTSIIGLMLLQPS